MKKLVSLAAALALAAATLVAGALPAQAAGNCSPYARGACQQRITVNAVSLPLTVSYGSGGRFTLPRATTSNFACGNQGGLYRVYVQSGTDVRLKGYFGSGTDSRYKTIYFTTTGWHLLPANFRSPKCTLVTSGYDKYGVIFDIVAYRS
jgi:hypothetical protein